MLGTSHDRPTGHLQPRCKQQHSTTCLKTLTLKPSMLDSRDWAVNQVRTIRALVVVALPTGLLIALFQQEKEIRGSSGRKEGKGRGKIRRRTKRGTRLWLLGARSVRTLEAMHWWEGLGARSRTGYWTQELQNTCLVTVRCLPRSLDMNTPSQLPLLLATHSSLPTMDKSNFSTT